MCGGNHFRARKLGTACERVAVETHQIRDKQEQPAHFRGELVRYESEAANIGYSFGRGTNADRALLVETAWQWRKALLDEYLAHGGGTQPHSLFLQRLADLRNGVISLAQRYDLLAGAALFGLLLRTTMRGRKEIRHFTTAKGMAEHAKGP